jgi:hypothetical protein
LLLAIGGFAVVSPLLIHAALAVEITPPGAGFSATFPIELKPRSDSGPESSTMLWVASNDSFIYVAGYSDYAQRPRGLSRLAVACGTSGSSPATASLATTQRYIQGDNRAK